MVRNECIKKLMDLLTNPEANSGLVGEEGKPSISEAFGKWTRMPLIKGQSDGKDSTSFMFYLKDEAVAWKHTPRIRLATRARGDFARIQAALLGALYWTRYGVVVDVNEDCVYDPVVEKYQYGMPYVRFHVVPV